MPNGQAGFDPNQPYQATAKGGFDPNAPYSAATTGNVATPSAAPERPGFFNRMSEQLGLTAHPLNQAKAELGMLYHHPLTTLEETGKNALSAVTGVPRNADWSIRGAFAPGALKTSLESVGGIPGMVVHPIKSSGGDAFAEDWANRNYLGMAGTAIGDVLPFAFAPETRSLAGNAARGVAERTADVRGRVGESIRTPEGKLKTMPKVGSQIAGGVGGAALGAPLGHEYIGAAAGYKLGPTLLESFFPDPNAELRARGAFMNKGYRSVMDMPSGGPLGRTTLGDEFIAGTKPRSLVLTPEEAATEERMQGIAKKRASERGMQFAAGMTPREGRAVPRYPARAPLEESEPVNVERLRQIAGPLDTPRLGEVPKGKPGEGAAAVGLTTEPPRTIPEQVAQSNVHLTERMKQVLRNPNATPAEIREARARLAEMGNR